MQDNDDVEESSASRSFWSGTVAFGLVSVPVSLFVANRNARTSLRMLDKDGTPLSRRYFCSEDGKALSRDELIRGYEIEKGRFVEVADEELDALVPEKSREIDLRRFVPLESIDPMYFERAYFLVPAEGGVKAYKLLAATMESIGRAGIATFVMRGKEYLIAIISERGILRAETLRFHDEIRTPADVGLPDLKEIEKTVYEGISKEIERLSSEHLDLDEMADEQSRKLRALIDEKLSAGKDVMPAPKPPEPESAEVIDIMEVLKRSLEAREEEGSEPSQERGRGGKKPKKKAVEHRDVDPNATKSELYELAKELHVPGRSSMSKDELLSAVSRKH